MIPVSRALPRGGVAELRGDGAGTLVDGEFCGWEFLKVSAPVTVGTCPEAAVCTECAVAAKGVRHVCSSPRLQAPSKLAGNRPMAYRPSAPKWMQGAPIAKGSLRFCRVALACTVRSLMMPRPWRVVSPEPLGA